jgi:PAS domain S-box-containing protein
MKTDISQRKPAQEKLQVSEAKYRALVENTKEIFYSVDTEGRILFLGSQSARYGIDPEDAVSRNILEYIALENREEVLCNLQTKMTTGEEFLTELRLIGDDGRQHWFEEDGSVVRDATGNITGIMGVLRDITERKKIEGELQRERHFSATALDSLPGLFYMYDSDGKLVRWNKNHETITGYSAEEIQDRHALDWFEEDKKDIIAKKMQRVFKEGDARLQANVVMKDGRKIPVDTVAHRMDLDGEHYIVGLGLDMTDSLTMQAAVHDKSEKLRAIIETSQDWIWAIDSQGAHTYCNPAIESILGYLPRDMLGKSSLKFLHPQDREYVESRLPELLQKKTGWQNMVLRWRHKDGSWRYLESSAVPILDTQGELAGFRGVDRDITERKRVEEEAQAHAQRLALHIQHTPLAVIEWDLDFRVVEWNAAAERVFGYSRGEALGRHAVDLVIPDEARKHVDLIWQALVEGKGGTRSTNANKTKGGGMRVCDWYNTTLVNPDGAIIGAASLVQDITDRRQVEEQLRESEQRFRTIMDSSADAILISDQKGDYAYANKAACTLLGYTPEELATMNITDISALEEGASLLQFRSLLESGRLFTEMDLVRKNGSVVPVELNAVVLPNGLVYGSCRDITKRQQAETELRMSEEKYRLLFESSPDAIMTLAPPSWRFTACNPASAKMFGAQDKADFVSRTPWEYSPPFQRDGRSSEEKGKWIIETTMREGSHFFEWTHRRPNGEEFPVTVWLNRVRLGNENVLQATVRDISEQHSMEAQLRQAQKLDSIGTLAGGVAHEINNPINGIMNYAQLILDRSDGDGSIGEFAGEIIHETKRVATIVKNLLSFARQNKQGSSPARVCDIINETLSLVNTVLGRDQITLSVDVSENLPRIKCRSQQIEQVIMNLITNARDALNEKYPECDVNKRIEVTVATLEKDGRHWLRTTVEDNGPGIPNEVRERMFDPFYTTKPRNVGTGLGLSISHGIINDHGGELSVESELGEWTRFHVDLPVHEPAEVDGEPPSESLQTGNG